MGNGKRETTTLGGSKIAVLAVGAVIHYAPENQGFMDVVGIDLLTGQPTGLVPVSVDNLISIGFNVDTLQWDNQETESSKFATQWLANFDGATAREGSARDDGRGADAAGAGVGTVGAGDWYAVIGETETGGTSTEFFINTGESVTLAVCVDCIQFIANGDSDTTPDDLADLIDAQWPSSDGWILGSGNDDDADVDDWEGYGFSWTPCESCGSNLGGDRDAAHAFKVKVQPPTPTADDATSRLNLESGQWIDGSRGVYTVERLHELVGELRTHRGLATDLAYVNGDEYADDGLIIDFYLAYDETESITISTGQVIDRETAADIVGGEIYDNLTDLLPTPSGHQWVWWEGSLNLWTNDDLRDMEPEWETN